MRLRHLPPPRRAILVLVGRSSSLFLAWIFVGIACQGPEAFNGGDAGGPILAGVAGSGGNGLAGAIGSGGDGGSVGGAGGAPTGFAGDAGGASGSLGGGGAGAGGAGQGGSGGAGQGGSGGAGHGGAGGSGGGAGTSSADAGVDVARESGAGDTAGGSCGGVAAYMEGKVYMPGDRTQNKGQLYQCRPFPNSGWCGLASNGAYTPGTGFAWMDAWTLVGPCP